jgi:hypothetical protein
MIHVIEQALRNCGGGYSPDRVVADPELNQKFIAWCHRNGLAASVQEINHKLLNFRKAGGLSNYRTTKRTQVGPADDFKFAAEISARYMEKEYKLKLDDILCDPDLANEFDEHAKELAPGFSSLQYRWAALNLRKTRKLRPEIVSQILDCDRITLGPIAKTNANDLPDAQGVYVFYTSNTTLYVGESGNLKRRVMKHLEHSDNKHLARWFWDQGQENIILELHVLPDNSTVVHRRALEAELIASRRAVFNSSRP